ncbi:class I SAM-dependent methyltransferase [Chloroflexota bacterium]
MMNSLDKELIIKRYRERLAKHGQDVKALASGNIERQLVRFQVLSEVGDLNNHSVLDIGCGFADFYLYLKEKGVKVDYTGIDICPDFIEICQARFPEAQFEVKDIQTAPGKRKFDYVISSQTFNNHLTNEDNETMIRDIIKRAYELSNIGVAIDMISNYVDFKEEHLYYYSPEDIFRYCKAITKRVTLRHDYPLFEFTIYLYQDFKGWVPG